MLTEHRSVRSGQEKDAVQMAATYSPNLDRALLKGKSVVEQMAEDFRIMASNAGSVDRDMLRSIGWMPAQIDKHGQDAADQARRLSEVQLAESEKLRQRSERATAKMLGIHLSEAQLRTVLALRLHGSLQCVRCGWAKPGTFDLVATGNTINAMIAAGFCRLKNYTSVILTKDGHAVARKLTQC